MPSSSDDIRYCNVAASIGAMRHWNKESFSSTKEARAFFTDAEFSSPSAVAAIAMQCGGTFEGLQAERDRLRRIIDR